MSSLSIRYRQTLGTTEFDIDLTLPKKGITAIFGRSGAGKTSLINAVAGLTKPQSGLISIGDHTLFDSSKQFSLPVCKRNIGYVFQDARLFPHYKVKGNLLYGVDRADDAYFEKIVTMLSLELLLQRHVSELSGGEKQRVAIGRALLSKPEILLMDEPLASLDLPRKREVMPFLETLAEEIQIPILYVSHSLHEVLRLADHLVIVSQGRVAVSGPIRQVWASNEMRPWLENDEQSSLFEGQVIEHNEKYGLSKVQLTSQQSLWIQKISCDIGTMARLQIRANDVSVTLKKPELTSIRNILEAKVKTIQTPNPSEETQFNALIELMLDDGCHLWASVTRWACEDLNLTEGQSVYAQVKGVSLTQKDIALTH